MPNSHIQPWTKISSKTLLSHPRLTVLEDIVQLPDKTRVPYVYLKNNHDAVTVIALHDNKILIQKEYSYPPNLVMYQLPGGRIEKGESPEKAGLRELKEESGYIGTTTYLGYYFPNNRRSAAKMHVITVRDIETCIKEGGDREEFIQSEWVPFSQLRNMIADNTITNFSILSAIEMYDARVV